MVRGFTRSLLVLLLPLSACDCGDGAGLQTVAPDIVARPNPLEFGQVFLGRAARRVLTVENAGSAALSVTSVRIEPGSHPNLTTDDLSFELAPGATQSLEVVLRLSTIEAVDGAVLIASDDPDAPVLRVPIRGQGARRPTPYAEVCVSSDDIPLTETCVDPLRVNFGAVEQGSSQSATVKITNRGEQTLDVREVSFRMGADPAFVASPATLATSLATDQSTTVRVSFTPSVSQSANAVLQVLSNDPDRENVPVIFLANGVESALCLSAASVDFGVVPVGQTADQSVTITNCGPTSVTLSALEIMPSASEFSVLDPLTMAAPLAPSETRDVRLQYAPVDMGRDTAALRVLSTAPEGVVQLVGQTAACDLSVLPTSVDFGPVGRLRPGTRTVVLQNDGASPCTVTSVALSMATSSEFSIVTPPSLPLTLAAGGTSPVELQYQPADAGSDMGVLRVDSDDPVEPAIDVPLTGRRLGLGECQLTAQPNPVGFGAVSLGSSRTMGVQITNAGSSICTLNLVVLSANSSRSFQVVPPAQTLPLLAAGASVTYEVIFGPLSAGSHQGTLEAFGLNPNTPVLTVPLSGSGAGAELCVEPTPVVFGTRMIGAATTRQVTLISCGSDTVNISAAELPAPTSTEYSLAPVSLPLSIPSGARSTVSLTYTGVDAGRDDGILRLRSNDALQPVQDVPLIAASSNGPCGDIQGKICGLGPNAGPVAGATVYVNTPGGRISTTTDANGDYVLTCVPVGTWTVNAESGQWSTSFSVQVNAYSVTSVPGQRCLEETSARVAVAWGEYDAIQDVLGRLNISTTLYGDPNGQSLTALLNDPAELARYDIIFFNCGLDEGVALTSQAQTNLRSFVNMGGSIYVSDWAYDLIEVSWPNAIDFDGNDTVRNAAQSTGNFSGLVNVIDAALRAQLAGRSQVQITSCCTGMDSVGMGTTTYIEGDRRSNGGTHPFMVGFQPTPMSGRVFYTDFHNNGQPDITDIFRWLITRL